MYELLAAVKARSEPYCSLFPLNSEWYKVYTGCCQNQDNDEISLREALVAVRLTCIREVVDLVRREECVQYLLESIIETDIGMVTEYSTL